MECVQVSCSVKCRKGGKVELICDSTCLLGRTDLNTYHIDRRVRKTWKIKVSFKRVRKYHDDNTGKGCCLVAKLSMTDGCFKNVHVAARALAHADVVRPFVVPVVDQPMNRQLFNSYLIFAVLLTSPVTLTPGVKLKDFSINLRYGSQVIRLLPCL
jgi:hypothetical protein